MTPPGTIYWGRYLVPFDQSSAPIVDGGVFVKAGSRQVTAIGDVAGLREAHPGAAEVGGDNRLVMPGLIDAHQHGRAVTPAQLGVRDEELELWLLEQRAMPPVDPAMSTLVAAARSIKGGVTTIVHPHVTANPHRRGTAKPPPNPHP